MGVRIVLNHGCGFEFSVALIFFLHSKEIASMIGWGHGTQLVKNWCSHLLFPIELRKFKGKLR